MISALLDELQGSAPAPRTAPGPELAARLLAMSDRIFGFLAFDAERPIGAMMLSEGAALYARGRFGVITELYVVPDRRSGGLAAELIKAAVELDGRLGWSQLEVGAPRQPEWKRSYEFYLKSGFTEMGRACGSFSSHRPTGADGANRRAAAPRRRRTARPRVRPRRPAR